MYIIISWIPKVVLSLHKVVTDTNIRTHSLLIKGPSWALSQGFYYGESQFNIMTLGEDIPKLNAIQLPIL